VADADSERNHGHDSFEVGTPRHRNGKVTLTVLPNALEVRADFYPALGNGAPLTTDYIEKIIDSYGIHYGIRYDEITKAYETCTSQKIPVKDVLIAYGDPPVHERPEFLQLNPALRNESKPMVDNNKAVDHRSKSPFIIVRKNSVLAKLKRHIAGATGRDVYGENIPYTVLQPDGLAGSGENTHMNDRYLLASISGQLIISKKIISVSQKLVIKGSVGYATGNILFPGDVEIHGDVSDGFKILSGGSITIKQTFDVTEASARGDLTVAGGIIGRGLGSLKVGGELRTKFVENCSLACRNNANIDLEIINSKIFTLESVIMGDKGRIVGGEIYALKGLIAGHIGRKSGKAARIHCGVDFTMDQEKEKNNAALKILASKKNRLLELLDAPGIPRAKSESIKTMLKGIEESQQKAQNRITELLGKLNAYEDAVVEVKGEIMPGTLIEICQAALFVTETLKKVRIKLDWETNKLVTERLK